jgi:transcriptional regulator with GAF, ATPase, and Fis domain
MQSLRGVRSGTKLEIVNTTKRKPATPADRDLSRGLKNIKEFIASVTLMIEAAEATQSQTLPVDGDFYENVERFETSLINRALSLAGGNQRRAAKLLGLNPTTLNAKIKRYGISNSISGFSARAVG